MIKGQIIGGEIDSIEIREKGNANIELSEILVCDLDDKTRILLQVYNLTYGSLVEKSELETTSGLMLEEDIESIVFEKELRLFKKVIAKPILLVKEEGNKVKVKGVKILPPLLSYVRSLEAKDLSFMSKVGNLFLGYMRNGSQTLDIGVYVDAKKVLAHHILIAGSTGKGKSFLMKNLLWELAKQENISLLVFDPHNEYYLSKNNVRGLAEFPERDKIVYFSQFIDQAKGGHKLIIPLNYITPSDLDLFDFSDPQRQAMFILYKKYNDYPGGWIAYLIENSSDDIVKENEGEGLRPETLDILRRKLIFHLALERSGNGTLLDEQNIFVKNSSFNAIETIIKELLGRDRIIIVDTSHTTGDVELLLANIIARKVFRAKKSIRNNTRVVGIVLEEAPRVIGKRVLAKNMNIFGTIAREGRKFGVGFIGITQIPSEIPKEILSNMNTKIILGLESSSERNAIIESASQDLSKDAKSIASLDIGEAIVTSVFTKFPIPFKVPDFNKKVEEELKSKLNTSKKAFLGLE